MCVQTPRAFYAEGGARAPSTDGLEGALSASAEQSEPRTPFDWSDKARTMQEEPARWLWAEDKDTEQEATIAVGEERALRLSPREEEGEYYYCSREATPLPPPSPIGDYAVVDPSPEEAPETQAPVNEKKVSVYFSGQRCGAARRRRSARGARRRRRPSRSAWGCRWARTRRWRAARSCTGWRGPWRRSGAASSRWRASCGAGPRGGRARSRRR
jgi:hypothetical protein